MFVDLHRNVGDATAANVGESSAMRRPFPSLKPPTDSLALTELGAAIERFEFKSEERTPTEVGIDLRSLRQLIDRLELQFSVKAAALADADEADWCGYPSAGEFIRHECKMSSTAAASAIYVGSSVAKLPESVEAMNSGRIGFGHLALMSSTAAALCMKDFDESPLLERALQHSVSRFRFDCAHARHAADVEAFTEEQVDQVLFRRLEFRPCGNGAVEVRGMLDPAGAAAVRTALEPLARRSGADDVRCREKRLADAFVEVANHCLDNGLVPQRANQRAHVQVTTSLETLQGLAGSSAGEMEFSVPIAAETVRRLACDSSVIRVLLGADSAVIDVGRAKRVVSAPLRRALDVRDKGCVWPGCDRSASWTNAHHIVFWADDGRTELDNLVLLCYRHHLAVHEGRWQLIRSDDGAILTVPPPVHYPWRTRPPSWRGP
jgi:hypothetical protein